MKSFKWYSVFEEWGVFIKYAASPLVIILFLFGCVMLLLSYNSNDNLVKICFSILAMLATGVLGARIISYFQTGRLEEKGKSAIRSLKLMMNDLTRLEKRLNKFLQIQHQNKDTRIAIDQFEEIKEKTLTLQEQTIASIENWTDVFPDADITSKVSSMISDRKRLDIIEEEKSQLEGYIHDLTIAKESDKNKIVELEKKLREKEAESNSLRDSFQTSLKGFDTGLLGGLDTSSASFATSAMADMLRGPSEVKGVRTCLKCGRIYSPGLNDFGFCSHCQDEIGEGM